MKLFLVSFYFSGLNMCNVHQFLCFSFLSGFCLKDVMHVIYYSVCFILCDPVQLGTEIKKRKEDVPGFKHAIHNICVAVRLCANFCVAVKSCH